MENELVRYSRAGDAFHYRWAARRCLRMINPKSRLRCLVIEGSMEQEAAGEYVIDVAEYYGSDENEDQEIAYYQLKHSTIRKDENFNLSDLKDTIEGFAKRYSDLLLKSSQGYDPQSVRFSIVTNRPISDQFKNGILAIRKGTKAEKRFQETLEEYTKLKDQHLQNFCISLELVDGEGDYNTQRHELHAEISQLLAGGVDNAQIDSIIALVQEQALPNSSGRIVREDILKRFGVTSERELFPAPPEFENLNNAIKREQHDNLLNQLLKASAPIIIHAGGGIGKSVVACQLANSLPIGSLGIVYDCFGAGRYRNRSEPRHRHRDALVQIANEIASHGLCDPLIPRPTDLDDALLRAFLTRLRIAATSLRQVNKDAVLAILIDAADNAEMAAEEFSEPCFAHQLLRDNIPDGCRLVALSRTERVHLLKPSSVVQQSELEPFSEAETLVHLRAYYPDATDADGLEFYRLTGGNPRVQANALSVGHKTVAEVLVHLGPSGTSVEEQIELQLKSAISVVKEKLPINFQRHIEAICLGLANLPPFIPLNVLSAAAEVDVAAIKSFVADLGRPLWLSDNSVQFRDEPTETWFRNNFSASAQQIESYLTHLKPLASQFSYVAEVLPSLLLQSENYDQLISLALSDDFLPKDSPIDERNVRVYRLQFAFKAALKLKRYADAAKLALRAGEEVAGDARQLELLKQNIDLIAPLQAEQRVQELAFRRMLRSGWDGSENAYSAALLSSVEDFKGEARGYLRAAHNWLRLYFNEREKKGDPHDDRLKDEDIVELAFAHFNLFGAEGLVDFILGWRPPEVVFRIARLFIRRLVDAGNFAAIDEISQIDHRNQYLMIAIADELLAVGKFPVADAMQIYLDLLTHKRARIPKPSRYSSEDSITSAIISLTEACTARGLSEAKILRVLKYYVPQRAPRWISSDYQDTGRNIFLRAAALKAVLSGNLEPNIGTLMPKELLEKKQDYQNAQDIEEFERVVGRLLPWYIARAQILTTDSGGIAVAIQNARQRSKSVQTYGWRKHDQIPFEISRVHFEILVLNKKSDASEVENFAKELIQSNTQFRLSARLKAVRAAYRLDHLSGIRGQLERSCYEQVMSTLDVGPEERAGLYIYLARAVLPVNRADAAAYFDYAIEAVSKFGDELVERWEAVVAMAKRSADGGQASPEMAYRFIRCAELVGDNVVREKYIDRDGAVMICAGLHPTSAFAALSRWRDRDVGWFGSQLYALAYEAVSSQIISPSVGWSLSAFLNGNDVDDFASLCIESELDPVRRQYILDTTVRDLRLGEASEKSWQELAHSAQQFSLENNELQYVLDFYAEQQEASNEVATHQFFHKDDQQESESIDWEKIFGGLDLTTNMGLSHAIERFKATPAPRNSHIFWQETLRRVAESDASDFLQAIVNAESADSYDAEFALTYFPNNWHDKASVKREWPKALKLIARRFASEFTNHYRVKYFLERIRAENNVLPIIREGIMEGLSENSSLADASTFFGFAETVSTYISPHEATDLLDFALSRFEGHINDDYADGPWANWLKPPEDMSDAFAGLVWAALGSPRSAIRWQAVHCVRRLAGAGCERELGALIQWMNRDSVDAFGSHAFPFYNLHARQYLLIAIARVALDNPEILRRHHLIFSRHALEGMSHILIQKYSAEIALSIETAFPGTYDQGKIERLRQVGVSQMEIKEIDRYSEKLESPWHARGEIDHNLKLHFGYDFDSYWFDPLGDVFGISAKQVEDLAREVVVKEWHLKPDDEFIRDPRANLWESSRHERETWHDHSSYPRTDNYSFYLSYHAMLSVAAKLLHEMPVVHKRDWYEEGEWSHWLHRHTLTRSDGRWLADRRDPAPLTRRAWLCEKNNENWRKEIVSDDFLEGLLFERHGETWLNVFGHWSDSDNQREESFHISTALVSPAASQSLLNALTTCRDPHDFKLPDYQEEDMEFETPPFELEGWIWKEHTDKRLDEFDPHAGDIDYPPYKIGKIIADLFGLSEDLEQREWCLPDVDKTSLVCEIWSVGQRSRDEEPLRHGKRMSASLEFLKKLCSTLEQEIIIEIQIERRLRSTSYKRDDNGPEYHSRIYILSADGKLRDSRTHYQLRQSTR